MSLFVNNSFSESFGPLFVLDFATVILYCRSYFVAAPNTIYVVVGALSKYVRINFDKLGLSLNWSIYV